MSQKKEKLDLKKVFFPQETSPAEVRNSDQCYASILTTSINVGYHCGAVPFKIQCRAPAMSADLSSPDFTWSRQERIKTNKLQQLICLLFYISTILKQSLKLIQQIQ